MKILCVRCKKRRVSLREIKKLFLSNVLKKPLKEGGCWVWFGAKTRDAYGCFNLQGKNYRAHRFSYSLFKGKIPDGMWILHSCDNPVCVNPKHLSFGTAYDNYQDIIRRGRSRVLFTENSHNSKLSSDDIDLIKNPEETRPFNEVEALRELGLEK